MILTLSFQKVHHQHSKYDDQNQQVAPSIKITTSDQLVGWDDAKILKSKILAPLLWVRQSGFMLDEKLRNLPCFGMRKPKMKNLWNDLWVSSYSQNMVRHFSLDLSIEYKAEIMWGVSHLFNSYSLIYIYIHIYCINAFCKQKHFKQDMHRLPFLRN